MYLLSIVFLYKKVRKIYREEDFMISILISIFCGMLPEVLFLTFFLIYTKNLKTKKVKLFLGIMLLYVVCIMLIRYIILNYLLFIFLIYILLKILYKNKAQITDIFAVNLALIYLTLNSFICSKFLLPNYENYYYILLLNRIILIIPFIFKNKFNYLYKKYYKLWNRNDKEKRPIKSITLRNISLIILNISIFIINMLILNIIK